MAIYITLLALLMPFISSTTSTNIPPQNQDLMVAVEEMQRANYFTFVMLTNMAPANLIQGNITFLMPNDRALSKSLMQEDSVVDFLLLHSIPSPLLFDHLVHIPTGTMIPTAKPEFMLKVSNHGGRRSFYLNNVRIVHPNICTAGSSIRCHGVDGVVQPMVTPGDHNTTLPTPTCSNSSRPNVVAIPPSPLWPSPAPPMDSLPPPLDAPPPSDYYTPQKSGSSKTRLPPRHGGFSLLACLMLAMKFSSWRPI